MEKDIPYSIVPHHCVFSLLPVVVDRRENKNCDTGKFELAYQQVTPTNSLQTAISKHFSSVVHC